MDKLKKIFHYLKSQDQISAETFDDFKARMTDPAKLERVYGYLKDEQLVESDNFDVFKQNIGFTDPNNEVPKFKTRKEHEDFHIPRVVEKMKVDNPQVFARYNEALSAGDQGTMQAMIMAAGGYPQFVEPKQAKTTTPTDWSKLDFKGAQNKKGGYRYDAGEGKPAKESITKRKD